jgi:uncharacterized protein (TIGR03435 family)
MRVVYLLWLATILSAQTPAIRPQFEVAAVEPAVIDVATAARLPMARAMMRNDGLLKIPMPDPGRVRLECWALLDLISVAYHVRAAQVSGPGWMANQSFDIEAKIPEGASREQVNEMLQSLLEDRFGLKVHREAHTEQGFVLLVGKNGPKLPPAELPSDTKDLTPEQLKAQGDASRDAMKKRTQEIRQAVGEYKYAKWFSITCDELAASLIHFTEAPVVDQTGLTEKYSVEIVTWNDASHPGGAIFDAVEKLGLKLEPRKVTVETVVVDQVSKTPTEN